MRNKTRGTFQCPASQIATLEQLLKSVTKVLMIGWQAREAHFLQMLRDNLPGRSRGVSHLGVVGANADGARATLTQFTGDLGYLAGYPDIAEGGFSRFVVNREGDAFLRA
jgi:hypothetical protein